MPLEIASETDHAENNLTQAKQPKYFKINIIISNRNLVKQTPHSYHKKLIQIFRKNRNKS